MVLNYAGLRILITIIVSLKRHTLSQHKHLFLNLELPIDAKVIKSR